MNTKNTVLALFLACASLMWAQTSTPQTPPADTQAQTGAGAAKGTSRGGTAGRMPGMGMMNLQQMQVDLNRMHALLNSMRGSVNSMEPRDQPAMLSNIELWQTMLDHMDQMLKHMQTMHGGMMDSGKPGPHAH